MLGDGAECGIKMITDFNSTLTKDETEKQHLLLVVEAHRQSYPLVRPDVSLSCTSGPEHCA